jgi:hypothetical protein
MPPKYAPPPSGTSTDVCTVKKLYVGNCTVMGCWAQATTTQERVIPKERESRIGINNARIPVIYRLSTKEGK